MAPHGKVVIRVVLMAPHKEQTISSVLLGLVVCQLVYVILESHLSFL